MKSTLEIALVSLMFLAGCAGFASAPQASEHAARESARRALSNQADRLASSSGSLYWGLQLPEPIFFKVRLSDGKSFKKGFGVEQTYEYALAVDKQQNVYEAVANQYTGSPNGVAVLNDHLEIVRMIDMASDDFPRAVTVDSNNQPHVSVENLNNTFTFSIQAFAADASGNATPISIISGSRTGLSLPTSLGMDGAGYLYVANSANPNGPPGNIEVFEPGANGNVKPSRSLGGSKTGLINPRCLTLGADGNLYVANETSSGFDVLVFKKTASGDVPPLRTLNSDPYGATVALGAGGQMYVGPGTALGTKGFAVYASGASGDDAPIGFVGPTDFGNSYYPGSLVLQYPWYLP